MGLATNLFIIIFVISAGLSLINPTQWGSPLVDFMTVTAQTGQVDFGKMVEKVGSIFAIAAAGGVVASIFTNDSRFGIIVGFSTFFLGVAIAPMNLFFNTDIPMFIRVLIGGSMTIMYLLGLVSWFSGGEL